MPRGARPPHYETSAERRARLEVEYMRELAPPRVYPPSSSVVPWFHAGAHCRLWVFTDQTTCTHCGGSRPTSHQT